MSYEAELHRALKATAAEVFERDQKNAALRQRIEELEREQPELIAIAIMQGQQYSADEIKRLREALDDIISAADSFQDEEGFEVAGQVRIRARAALQGRAG